MSPRRSLTAATPLALVIAIAATVFAFPHESRPQTGAVPFPSLIEDETRPDLPRWIAAELLVDVFGRLRREHLPEEIAKFLRGREDLIDEINGMGAVANSRSMPCVVNYAVVGDGSTSDTASSLYDLMRVATLAVSGQVEHSIGGFWQGHPATVITVKVTETFKQRPDGEIPAYINVPIVFVADFAIGSARVCAKAGQWSQAPKPGDEVFLFPRKDLEANAAVLLIDPAGYEIIFTTTDELIVPGRLSRSLKLDATSRNPQLVAETIRQSLRALRQ